MNPHKPSSTAIVTGASAGIGEAIARKLATDGLAVALVARSEERLNSLVKEINSKGGKTIAVPADIADVAQVREMVQRVETELGAPGLLVNNAGRLSAIGPLWENDPEEWWGDVEVNLKGLYLCIREVLPGMQAAGRGRIVNMTGGGAGGPFPFVSAYAVSKAAVVRLTENLYEELRKTDSPVKVFVTSPGFVRTAMTEQFLKSDKGRKWMGYMGDRFEAGLDVPPTFAAELVSAIASGRLDAWQSRYLRAPDVMPVIDEFAGREPGEEEGLLRFLDR